MQNQQGSLSATPTSAEGVKLFACHVPRDSTEETLHSFFSSYGPVLEVRIIRDKENGQHKGCAFVTYANKEVARVAIETLNEKCTLNGMTVPLQLRLSDAEIEKSEQRLFVSVFPKYLVEEDLKKYFTRFGEIVDFNIIRGPGNVSRGCAFLRYATREQALNAIQEGSGRIILEGTSKPLHLKFAETPRQKTQRKMIKALHQQSQVIPPRYPFSVPNQHSGMPVDTPIYKPAYSAPYMGDGGMSGNGPMRSQMGNPVHVPPGKPVMMPFVSQKPLPAVEGTSLFIYHLPQEFTDQDLGRLFGRLGPVLSAKVFIDKMTGKSKCFGFVTYADPELAKQAISLLDGYQIGNKRLKVQYKRVENSVKGGY
eukprot:TRINITY_DN3390_c0_g1_i1.p1 TRINITY_DN3390_c0_g1~~TRINITY_DN3390_c0_g1_i1.p1  ORF type:complete len:367 (-),score=71.68 TRINITY_DN3390_c0_g1_i1:1037-2137(-)